jgi:hypothetical protein
MSKNSKKRRDARAKPAKALHSTLGQHQRQKSKLIPPLNRMPAPMTHSNWMHDRMPEMLWACLVRAVLPRDEALQVFREVAVIARDFRETSTSIETLLPTHTNLAAHHPQLIPEALARTSPVLLAKMSPVVP